MTIYVVFLVFVMLVAFFCRGQNTENQRNQILFLNIVWIAMFLLCVFRASTVGRDLPGYERIYERTDLYSWSDFGYVYFENGYILLMKICTRLHFSFQWFLTVVTLITMLPIYVYIRKYSKNYFLSTLIYLCYMFFEFNMTALRQAMAASIVLIAYMLYISAKRFPTLSYIAIVLLAAQFHKGALICLVFPILMVVRNLKLYTGVVIASCVSFIFVRGSIMAIIKDFFEKDSMRADAEGYFGLNAVFTVALLAFFLVSYYNRSIRLCSNDKAALESLNRADDINIRLFMIGIPVMILFGMATAARSYMMFSQVMIVQLPNAIDCWKTRDKKIIGEVLVVFLVVFFFTNTLIANSFDIVPYLFFW